MQGYVPPLNLPSRHRKGLVKHGTLGGDSIPFYFVRQVVKEGTPLLLDTSEADLAIVATPGSTHGPKVIGLSMQETYDDALLGQLAGYNFVNDTRQPISTASGAKNPPIGILGGRGYASTLNYWGTVANGQQAAIGASGYLVGSTGGTASGDKLPVVFEGAGTNSGTGTHAYVRIRHDFPRNV